MATPQDSLVAWFVQPGTESGAGGASAAGTSVVQPVLVDSTGWTIGTHQSGAGRASGQPQVCHWVFDAFPRRDPTLRLRFMNGNEPVAEFSAPNFEFLAQLQLPK